MVTIQNLEVSFEVEGDGDEAVFARLFSEYIKRWNRQQADMKETRHRFESECALIEPKQERTET